MKPKVSVLMSVYNGENYVSETIRSILNQSFEDFEFIIINDGSTDLTQSILEQYCKRDKRIKIFNQKNSGLTKSLNRGIESSCGKYIARQDCGDISINCRLSEQFKFMENNPDYAVVGSLAKIIGKKGNLLFSAKPGITNETIKHLLPKKNQFIHGSVMIRKNHLLKIGKYREEFLYAQDYDLWLRFLNKYKLHNINKHLYLYRLDFNGISYNTYYIQQEFSNLARRCYRLMKKKTNEKSILVREAKNILLNESENKNKHCYYNDIGKLCFNGGSFKEANKYFKKSINYKLKFDNVFYYLITLLPTRIMSLILHLKNFFKYDY